ncbi:MAG: exosortase system-associated protein, TIGR04073 family [Methylococcales bacterium]|nr:exosortase system-associated protein, TIGR04073 family [Methylococcales bacterium]
MKKNMLSLMLASTLLTASATLFADDFYSEDAYQNEAYQEEVYEQAETYEQEESIQQQEYHQQPSYHTKVQNKAINGFTNMMTSVWEIPKSMINVSNNSNIVYGLTGGFVKGALNTAGRFVTGLFDLVTSPIPTKSIIQPAYIWHDYEATTSYNKMLQLDD